MKDLNIKCHLCKKKMLYTHGINQYYDCKSIECMQYTNEVCYWIKNNKIIYYNLPFIKNNEVIIGSVDFSMSKPITRVFYFNKSCSNIFDFAFELTINNLKNDLIQLEKLLFKIKKLSVFQ